MTVKVKKYVPLSICDNWLESIKIFKESIETLINDQEGDMVA